MRRLTCAASLAAAALAVSGCAATNAAVDHVQSLMTEGSPLQSACELSARWVHEGMDSDQVRSGLVEALTAAGSTFGEDASGQEARQLVEIARAKAADPSTDLGAAIDVLAGACPVLSDTPAQ